MIEKKIGKIESVNLGMGGYQDAMIGFNFTLGSESEHWGVNTEWQGHWAIERSEHAKWTEEARIEALGKAFQYLGRLLHDAKKTNVNQLVGVPIEATFEGMVLKDWRILKEVI